MERQEWIRLGIRVGRLIYRGWSAEGMKIERENPIQASNQPSMTEITGVSESVYRSKLLQEPPPHPLLLDGPHFHPAATGTNTKSVTQP
jgi:hypothetical protein